MRPIDLLALHLDCHGSPDEVIQRAIDRLSEDTKALAHISEEAAKSTDYAELNLRWRRYGERLQLAMLELEERTRPDGDMADAPVNALVKNALLDAFDAYQPGSESEIGTGNAPPFSEPVDSSGGPIGADVAARQWRENAVRTICVGCDGCGWCEGSPAFKCERCNGTGEVAA